MHVFAHKIVNLATFSDYIKSQSPVCKLNLEGKKTTTVKWVLPDGS